MTVLYTQVFLKLVRIYQVAISPLLPASCRFYPSCSEYARLCLLWHSASQASTLIIKRVIQCHPLGASGLDFPPAPLYHMHFKPSDTDRYQHAPRVCCMHYQALLTYYLQCGAKTATNLPQNQVQ